MYNKQRISGLLGNHPNTGAGLLPLPQGNLSSNYDTGLDSYDNFFDRRSTSRLQDDFDDYRQDYDLDRQQLGSIQKELGGRHASDSGVGLMDLGGRRSSDMGLMDMGGRHSTDISMGLMDVGGRRGGDSGLSLMGVGGRRGGDSGMGLLDVGGRRGGDSGMGLLDVGGRRGGDSGMGLMDVGSRRDSDSGMGLLDGGDSLLGNGSRNSQQNLLGNVAAQISLVNSLLQKASGVGLADLQNLANRMGDGSSGSNTGGLGMNQSNLPLGRQNNLDFGVGMQVMDRSSSGYDQSSRLVDMDRPRQPLDSRSFGPRLPQPQMPSKRPQPLLDMDVGSMSGPKKTRFSSGSRTSGGLLPSPSAAVRREESRSRSGNAHSQERKSRFSDWQGGGHGRDSDRRRNNSRSERNSATRKSESNKPGQKPSPQSRDPRGRSSSESKKPQEEYDPSQPTDDHETTVKETSSVSTKSPKRDVTKDMKVTIENKDKNPEDEKPFHCHACNIDCGSQKAFTSHMQSKKHSERMNQMFLYHKEQEAQNQARRVAEKHLRQIEGKKKRCKVCDRDFLGDPISHRRSTEHKRKERLVARGCPLCHMTSPFESYPAYVKHISGVEHKKKKAAIAQITGEEDVDFPDDLEGMVTIDAIGECSDEESSNGKDKGTTAKAPNEGTGPVLSSKGNTSGEVHEETTPERGPDGTPEVTGVAEAEPSTGVNDSVMEEKLSVDDSVGTGKESAILEESPLELEELPAFSPDTALGQDYVIAVSGFFCKLCHKFYNSKTAAMVTHCQSKPHYEKLKVAHKKKQKKLAEALTKSIPVSDDMSASENDSQADLSSSRNGQVTDAMKTVDLEGPELQIVSVTSLSEWSGDEPAAADADNPVMEMGVQVSLNAKTGNTAKRGGKAARGGRK